jgi:hypothetical protein
MALNHHIKISGRNKRALAEVGDAGCTYNDCVSILLEAYDEQ